MSSNGTGPEEISQPVANQDEYNLMLQLEELESLEEELEEVGFGTLSEVQAALAGYKGNPHDDQYQVLEEVRDMMTDLNLDSLREIRDQIRQLHEQLDNE